MKKDNNLLVLKCLNYFLENPYSKVYLREFSRIMKISPNSSQRFLNLFLKEGLVVDERVSNLRYFKANVDSIFFRQIKKTSFIKKLIDSGIVKSIGELSSSFALFGSCAKGLNDSSSDIDFLVISSEKKNVLDLFSRFQRKFSEELSPHVFTFSEWRKQKLNNKAFYQEVVSGGIVIEGEEII